jgi:small subunit ribosomal protein S15
MLKKTKKEEIIKGSQIHPTDTGSVEAQTSLLSARILELTEHLKVHKKDLSSRMGLMKLVAERRKLLTYLKRTSHERYAALIEKLNLKK